MSVADASGVKVSELEREVEHSRDQVSQTLDELQSQVSGTIDEWKHRLTAEEISKEVKAYVTESGRKLATNVTSSIETRFRENPASLVAMGAIAAWPVYRLARKIPLPVYLMGAGVALMKPMGRAWEHGREAFADLTPPNRDYGDDVDLADRARGMLESAAPGMQQRLNRGIEQASETAHRISDTVAATVSEAVSGIGDAAQSVGSTAQQVYGSATDIASELPRRAGEATARAGRASREAAGNPWVIGMVGVAATAALAAALPRGTVRRGTRVAASAARGGVAGARAAIERAYEVAVNEGLASGLTLGDAENTARSFVAKMMPEQQREPQQKRGKARRKAGNGRNRKD